MNKFKNIWISDLHLGSSSCKADQLLSFLKEIKCEKLFLVGDIIDGWRLSKKWFFPQSHLLVIRKILSLSKRKKTILWCAGNHDEFIRPLIADFNINIGDIELVNKYVHTINNKTFLVIHGDSFDILTKNYKWIALFGDSAYLFSVWLNNYLNKFRFLLGMKYWSLSKFLKNRIKSALNFILAFEKFAVDSAKSLGYTGGIICGHVHSLSLYKSENGLIYANDSDWTETCGWLAETYDGKLQTWEWNNGNPKLIKEIEIL